MDYLKYHWCFWSISWLSHESAPKSKLWTTSKLSTICKLPCLLLYMHRFLNISKFAFFFFSSKWLQFWILNLSHLSFAFPAHTRSDPKPLHQLKIWLRRFFFTRFFPRIEVSFKSESTSSSHSIVTRSTNFQNPNHVFFSLP